MTGGRPLRLLIVGLNYAPEQVGIGPYTTGLAETLASRGHDVRVVTGEPYYPEWRRREGEQRRLGEREENGVKVTRCRHYVPARPSGLRRVIHLASFSFSALWPAIRQARRQRPDAVLVVAPSLLSVPVAWLAARLGGARLWIHVQDFEVEAAFATGLIDGNGLAARFARGLENRLLRLADRVSTISPQMLAALHRKGIPAARTFEFRNWFDERFAPDEAAAARYREEWNIGARKVALYSGNIANKQGIEIVVDAARILAHREDIVFVICGQGPNRAQLETLAAGLANVQFHDLQPAERMGGLLALADLHLLPQIPGAADLVLPSKLTNMLASGRPVIATAAPGTGLAEEVADCGVVTPPGDSAAFGSAIAALLDDSGLCSRLGRAAAARARERWDRAGGITKVEAQLTLASRD